MPDLTGLRAIVTGGNSGIGLVTVRELLRHGADVVMAVRDPARGAAAQAVLAGEGLRGRLEIRPLDLASLGAVHRFAASVTAVDLLINNAGIMAIPRRTLTEDGFEMQFGVNHLGHFALTTLLLPMLRQSQAGRVITVASLAHRRARLDFDNLQGERRYTAWGAYSLSKLANLLFAQELRRRHEGQVTSIAVHPGVAYTNLAERGPAGGWTAPFLRATFRVIGQAAARGALPTLQAAVGASAPGAVYVGPDGPREMFGYPKPAYRSALARDEAAARRLWEVSEGLVEKARPGALPLHPI